MQRRDFITLLGGAAAAWPLAATAQQGARVRRVAVLRIGAIYDPSDQRAIASLRDGLERHGWVEGRNLRLDIRYAAGDPNAVRPYADELIALAPEVIVVSTGLITTTMQQRTQSIPIVFAGVGDPVTAGLVSSIARPKGNVTGITNLYPSIAGKWLELLKDAVPQISKVVLLRSVPIRIPNNDGSYIPALEEAGKALGIRIVLTPFRNATELEHAIETAASQPNTGLILHPPGLVGADRELMYRVTAKHRLPAIYQSRDYPAEGGLMSYGSNAPDLIRQAASYVDRLLRGAKVSELPVQFPAKFELVVNLKTAKAIGLTIPEAFLLRADEVIE